jgi:hypothetical protein
MFVKSLCSCGHPTIDREEWKLKFERAEGRRPIAFTPMDRDPDRDYEPRIWSAFEKGC